MTFRGYLIVMSVATAAAWTGWGMVLNSIDPTQTGAVGFSFFYLTLAIALLGTLALVGVLIRIKFNKKEIISRQVARSFRQSFLLTGLLIIALLLLPNDLFRWWVMGLLILFAAFIELAVMSLGRSRG